MGVTLIAGHHYTQQDVMGTLRALPAWWSQLLDGREVPADVVAIRAIYDIPLSDGSADEHVGRSLEQLAVATRRLREVGAMPTRATGSIAQLSASSGGVPKRSVEQITITRNGVVGDGQSHRVHHGRPWQAMCLWAAEVVDAFTADGHPISYGSAGENITTVGIDWSSIGTGVRLQVGTALLECSLWALPCSANTRWFTGGNFNLMHHEHGPVSRMYAWVIEPGVVALGDQIIVEP